ncbi:hypothetical protein [Alcaligenes endophyticus]|uniref:Uncharacterized protein n=1 Tax=Alcaligenes endophyticus TaxID=1929088 RepID=A0ABT8EGC0_9BURK|nr:hypothetical protein [Alcaligenes endophyticus]MCX5590008.1 hypothetical protein [Alcaligenes endophyticus]MDN4120329.1 hypothetical protein [Alcaligenes endophyticus]
MSMITRMTLAMMALCLGIGLVPPVGNYAANAQGLNQKLNDQAPAEQRLTQALAAVADIRQALDKTQFDIEALIESLDYDPEAIIDFVRDEIHFQPYEGLLRGAQGTLMGRAGNTLDQSLLLALLLKEAGLEARLARGTLDHEQASMLVRSLRGQTVYGAENSLSDLEPSLQKLVRAAGLQGPQAQSVMQALQPTPKAQELPIWTSAVAGRDYLMAQLGNKAGAALARHDAEAELARQSTDYFWVEFKDGAAAPWQRVHVVASGDVFNAETLPATEYFSDHIPESMQHRLRLRVRLERLVSGKPETIDLMDPWERPVANLTGKRLTFANRPNGFRSLQDLNDLSMIEASTTFLLPTLNDAPAPGALVFDLRGRTIPLSTLAMDGMGAAELFRTVGDQTLAAADALAGLSFGKTKNDEVTLTALSLRRVWLEYTSIHPNGTERVDERTLWLMPETVSPAPNTVLWELATPHGIGVATSEYPASYLLDMELSRMQSFEPILRWALQSKNGTVDDSPANRPATPPEWSGFPELAYLSQFDAGVHSDQNLYLAYRAEPSIVVTRHGLRTTPNGPVSFADVDILHNRRTVLYVGASRVQFDPTEAIRLGVWDTIVEQVELQARESFWHSSPSTKFISANRMYQTEGTKTPLLLKTPTDATTLLTTAVDEPTRIALEQDLSRGYVVLAEAPAADVPMVWWRIQPQTGETLGRALDGRGQALSEYQHALTVSAFSTSAIAGTALCYGSDNSCSFAECLGTAMVVSGIVTGAGAAGAALGPTIWGALFSGVGVVGTLATHPATSNLPVSLPSCFRS